jgi:peptidoglycan/LPS O-acetylase OafA/YrhL
MAGLSASFRRQRSERFPSIDGQQGRKSQFARRAACRSLDAGEAVNAPERQSLAPAKDEDLRPAPMKSAHLPTPTRHIYGIDVMRFLAAVTVAVFHFTWQTPSHFAFAPWGWIGVEVFFVVSGIVIAGAVKGSSPGAFAFNRFLRLYPAAWICGLIGAIVLTSAHFEGLPYTMNVYFSWHRLLESMILFAPQHLASAYWTLPIEISFYAFVTVFFFFNNQMAVVARSLIGASAVYYVLFALDQMNVIVAPWTDLFGIQNALLVRHAPYFVIGIYIYKYLEEKGEGLTPFDPLLLGLLLVMAVMQIVIKARITLPMYGGPVEWLPLAAVSTAIFLCCGLFLCLSIAFNDRIMVPAPLKSTIRAIGLMTYPYYLLHQIVGATVMFFAGKAGVPFFLSIALALISVGLVSFAVLFPEAALRQTIRRSVSPRVPEAREFPASAPSLRA